MLSFPHRSTLNWKTETVLVILKLHLYVVFVFWLQKSSAAALFFHIDQHLEDRDSTGDLEATFIYSLCLSHLHFFFFKGGRGYMIYYSVGL
jgi:hypothetical protein